MQTMHSTSEIFQLHTSTKKDGYLRQLGPQLRDYSLDQEISKLHPSKSFLSRRYGVKYRTLRLSKTHNSN